MLHINENQLEYELLSITIEQPYEMPEDDIVWRAGENRPEEIGKPEIEYDAEGVPMGQTMPEIHARETLIVNFLRQWGTDHPERKVLNDALEEYIHIKGISVIEAKEHSSKNYKSTKAVMILEEVLKHAKPIKRVPAKPNDKNQLEFEYFVVMLYKHVDIGSIKLTIGVRKRNALKVQYGISVLKPDQPLVDYSQFKRRKKKRSPRK